jgi:hypothetical protein
MMPINWGYYGSVFNLYSDAIHFKYLKTGLNLRCFILVVAKELHLTSKWLKAQYRTEIIKCHLGGIYKACLKSFLSGVAEQRYIGHVRCYLSMYVCMYKGWAFTALAPRPTVVYCA